MHIDDLVNMYIQALQPDSAMKGVYNGTAPQPVRMKELCSSLGRAMHRPSWLPVPEFALKVCSSGRCKHARTLREGSKTDNWCAKPQLCGIAGALTMCLACAICEHGKAHVSVLFLPLHSTCRHCSQRRCRELQCVRVQALLGEGAMVVAEGQKVLPKETQNSGFQFAFSDVDSALTDLL